MKHSNCDWCLHVVVYLSARVFVCVGLQFCIVALYHNAHCAYKSFLVSGQETVDGSEPARAWHVCVILFTTSKLSRATLFPLKPLSTPACAPAAASVSLSTNHPGTKSSQDLLPKGQINHTSCNSSKFPLTKRSGCNSSVLGVQVLLASPPSGQRLRDAWGSHIRFSPLGALPCPVDAWVVFNAQFVERENFVVKQHTPWLSFLARSAGGKKIKQRRKRKKKRKLINKLCVSV